MNVDNYRSKYKTCILDDSRKLFKFKPVFKKHGKFNFFADKEEDIFCLMEDWNTITFPSKKTCVKTRCTKKIMKYFSEYLPDVEIISYSEYCERNNITIKRQ